MLLLGVLHGSQLSAGLSKELHLILLDEGHNFSFAERHDASRALIALDHTDVRWPSLVERLMRTGDTRLALDLMDDAGLDRFDNTLITRAILAHVGLLGTEDKRKAENEVAGSLYFTTRNLPESKIAPILDLLAEHKQALGAAALTRRSELADNIASLITRQLGIKIPEPLALLKWLRITPARDGYSNELKSKISACIQEEHDLRRAIQRHVILNERDHENAWSRFWDLREINHALWPNADDVIVLLHALANKPKVDEDDVQVWRELAGFSHRIDGRAKDIIDAAHPFAIGRPELENDLANLSKPRSPSDWEKRENRQRRRKQRATEDAWGRHRKNFADNIEALRAGELRWSFPVSQAYLGLFQDTNRELLPPDRLGEWLGQELQLAALEGFEAVLGRLDLPSLHSIAEGYAKSQRWNFVLPMIAGIAERVRTRRGFNSVPVDAVLAVRIALHHEHFADGINQEDIAAQLDDLLRRDPTSYEKYIRLLIEPALEHQNTYVPGLYSFMRSAPDRELANKLAKEWLHRFDSIQVETELELIDALAESGEYDFLERVAARRAKLGYVDQRHRRNWLALRVLTNFTIASSEIRNIRSDERNLLWHFRHRFGNRSSERTTANIPPAALGWVIQQFRAFWPLQERPSGVTMGDTNSWDASDFIRSLINRLASDTSDEATSELEQLVAAGQDSYHNLLLYAAYQQRHARREINFRGIPLERLRDITEDKPPKTTDDLLAIIRYGLSRLKKQLHGNDTDSILKYWRDNGHPRDEDRCTDALIEDLERLLPHYGIGRAPQADMPKSKIADVIFTIGDASLPVECKGQWNRELWTAWRDQLDLLYLRDWRSQGRGLYLVYWFGTDVDRTYRITAPPDGAPRPTTPEELRILLESIATDRRGSVVVEVLDLTR
jgi:hypothetical protein